MKVKELLTNKVVLYIVLFLAVTNVLGYVSIQDSYSLVMFAMVAYLTTFFTKNMVVVLLTALLVTNAMKSKAIRPYLGMEGFRSKKEKNSKPKTKTKKEEELVEEQEEASEEEEDANMDELVKDMVAPPEKEKYKNLNSKKMHPKSLQKKNSKDDDEDGDFVDQAATLEAAYDNIDKMLGKGGIQNLTKETQALIGQQKEMAGSLKSMAPMMKEAMGVLNGMNIGSLTKMTEKLAGSSFKK